jgi:hypothetical protein
MNPIQFTILGIIFELIGFFILVFISLLEYTWLFNRLALKDNTLNKFGRFLKKYFCWNNRTPYVGFQRFSTVVSFSFVLFGTIFQITALMGVEVVLLSNASLFDYLHLIIICIIILLSISWLIFKDKNKRDFITTLFTVIIVVLAFFSASYAYQTVDWYKNPQPLYQSWTNVDSEIINNGAHTVRMWTGYSPHDGLNSTLTGWNNLKDFFLANLGFKSPSFKAV